MKKALLVLLALTSFQTFATCYGVFEGQNETEYFITLPVEKDCERMGKPRALALDRDEARDAVNEILATQGKELILPTDVGYRQGYIISGSLSEANLLVKRTFDYASGTKKTPVIIFLK